MFLLSASSPWSFIRCPSIHPFRPYVVYPWVRVSLQQSFCCHVSVPAILYCLISIVCHLLSVIYCLSSIVCHLLSVIYCLSSIVNRQSSIVNRQLSIVNCQLSIVNCRQSSIVNRQSSSIVYRLSSIVNRPLSFVRRPSIHPLRPYVVTRLSSRVSLHTFLSSMPSVSSFRWQSQHQHHCPQYYRASQRPLRVLPC